MASVQVVGSHAAVRSANAPSDAEWVSQRVALALPVLLTALYPWLVLVLGYGILHLRFDAGASVPLSWAEVVFGLLVVYAVPALGLAYAIALGRLEDPTPRQARARRIAHVIVAAPSLLVGMGNVAGLFGARTVVPSLWIALWLVTGLYLLFGPVRRAPSSVVSRRGLRIAHGLLAVGILVLFLLPHLSNHIVGFWSSEAHIRTMTLFRELYRSRLLEPILVAFLAAQSVTGLALLIARTKTKASSVFDTLQTVSGVYIAVFLVSHSTAAFSARWANVDTNWHWLTNNGVTMLGRSPNVALLPHYFLGPLVVAVHLACGLRSVLLEHSASIDRVNRAAGALIALGAAASLMITSGLLGVHLGG